MASNQFHKEQQPMCSLFIVKPPSYSGDKYCLGIELSSGIDSNSPVSGYVNGMTDAKITWQFEALLGTGSIPNLEQQVESSAFCTFPYLLSGDIEKVKKYCILTPTPNHSISAVNVILNLIPESIFYTAPLQSRLFIKIFNDDGKKQLEREFGPTAKKRTFKSGDPILFCFKSNQDVFGVAVLNSELTDKNWDATLYLIGDNYDDLEGTALLSKQVNRGNQSIEYAHENVRSTFEVDLGTIVELKSHSIC